MYIGWLNTLVTFCCEIPSDCSENCQKSSGVTLLSHPVDFSLVFSHCSNDANADIILLAQYNKILLELVEQHGSTRRAHEKCWEVTWRAKWNLGYNDWVLELGCGFDLMWSSSAVFAGSAIDSTLTHDHDDNSSAFLDLLLLAIITLSGYTDEQRFNALDL